MWPSNTCRGRRLLGHDVIGLCHLFGVPSHEIIRPSRSNNLISGNIHMLIYLYINYLEGSYINEFSCHPIAWAYMDVFIKIQFLFFFWGSISKLGSNLVFFKIILLN